MFCYRSAGQVFYFPYSIGELFPFEVNGGDVEKNAFASPSFSENGCPQLISRTEGWVAGAQRIVEVYDIESGFLIKIEGGGEFFVTPQGEMIGKLVSDIELSQLDREILLGPVLVLALALRGVWSLHASAVMFHEMVIVFLGESGQGKSTLAGYLAQNLEWRLVADDILPVTIEPSGITVWPHFPQLKLPAEAQPCVGLPEQLPLKSICVLEPVEPAHKPELQRISTAQGVRSLLSHIAGTRMFDATLLAKHLEFCAQAAEQISFCQLSYPHRRDALSEIREALETLY